VRQSTGVRGIQTFLSAKLWCGAFCGAVAGIAKVVRCLRRGRHPRAQCGIVALAPTSLETREHGPKVRVNTILPGRFLIDVGKV